MLVTSALFGLWHISPTLGTMSDNRQLGDATSNAAGETFVVLGAVLTTFVAGLVFAWLRLRSRSLLAPVLAHLGTNAVAFVLAWIIVRCSAGGGEPAWSAAHTTGSATMTR